MKNPILLSILYLISQAIPLVVYMQYNSTTLLLLSAFFSTIISFYSEITLLFEIYEKRLNRKWAYPFVFFHPILSFFFFLIARGKIDLKWLNEYIEFAYFCFKFSILMLALPLLLFTLFLLIKVPSLVIMAVIGSLLIYVLLNY
jgi:hypothetical protein